MEQPQPQAFVQPQFVMMPVAQRNGLGVFGFFIALIGLLVPTGLVSVLGLTLSLAAIGRAPRGFATFGVILGLVGTALWLVVMAVVVVVGLVAALGAAIGVAGAFVLTQPEVVEVTSDMVNVAMAVEEYQQENDGLPEELGALGLGLATGIDPWGNGYRLEEAEGDPGFDVVSGGPDGELDTEDDVRLTRLDRFWEEACEGFGEKMEELGERFERLEGFRHDGSGGWAACAGHGPSYERKARRELEAEHHPH